MRIVEKMLDFNVCWTLWLSPSGMVTFSTLDPSTNSQDTPYGPLTEFGSRWHHVAASWDRRAAIGRLYVNGLLVNQGVHTPRAYGAVGDLILGSSLRSSAFIQRFHGQLDDFRFYEGVLTNAEIQAIVSEGSP